MAQKMILCEKTVMTDFRKVIQKNLNLNVTNLFTNLLLLPFKNYAQEQCMLKI